MKTHKILYVHNGEVSYTKHDCCAVVTSQEGNEVTAEWRNGTVKTVDLTQEKEALVSHDNWMIIKVNKWSVSEVELPDWMSPFEWIDDYVCWKYAWGFGIQEDWPESWQRKLKYFSSIRKLACVKLLQTKKFRSKFRQSLRNQLEAWLDEVDPQYRSPFSHKQWECICNGYVAREARQIENSLYYNR